jgi:hypothetical protein
LHCINIHQSAYIFDFLDVYNRTPLFYAASNGNKDVVKVLLSNSSASIRDRYGATPLCVAVRNGHVDVVKQLITFAKEKSDFEDGFGRNLLWWAAGSGEDTMVDIVCQFAQEIGIEAPKTSEGKECVVVKLRDESANLYCTICTRDIDGSYLKCQTCAYFYACLQCAGFKVECFDSSHTWKLQELDSPGDSGEKEDNDEDPQ